MQTTEEPKEDSRLDRIEQRLNDINYRLSELNGGISRFNGRVLGGKPLRDLEMNASSNSMENKRDGDASALVRIDEILDRLEQNLGGVEGEAGRLNEIG